MLKTSGCGRDRGNAGTQVAAEIGAANQDLSIREAEVVRRSESLGRITEIELEVLRMSMSADDTRLSR